MLVWREFVPRAREPGKMVIAVGIVFTGQTSSSRQTGMVPKSSLINYLSAQYYSTACSVTFPC